MSRFLSFLKSQTTSRSYNLCSPYTGEVIHKIPLQDHSERIAQIKQAKDVYESFKNVPLRERLEMFEKVLAVVHKEESLFTQMITESTGKNITESRREFNQAISVARGYINLYSSKIDIIGELYRPMGTSFILTSWKSPLLNSFSFLTPSFLSGNISILKPSSKCPLVGLELEHIFREEAFDGSVVSLLLESKNLFEILQETSYETFLYQGNPEYGINLNDLMDRRLKLDRKFYVDSHATAIVIEPECMDTAADIILDSAFQNSGQSEHSLKQLYIHSSCYSQFREILAKKCLALRLGNPIDNSTQIGPLCKKDTLIEGKELIEGALFSGANVIVGGEIISNSDDTLYFQPTLIEGVDQSMDIYYKEMLEAPILLLQEFEEVEDIKKEINDEELDDLLLISGNPDIISLVKDKVTIYVNIR